MNNASPGNEPDMLSFEAKRAIVGGLSLTCLLLAGFIYLTTSDWNNVMFAGAVRIGVVLFATWLALPQLRGIMSKVPSVLPVVALVLIVFCAARPKLFLIVGSLIGVATVLFGISNWLKRMSPRR